MDGLYQLPAVSSDCQLYPGLLPGIGEISCQHRLLWKGTFDGWRPIGWMIADIGKGLLAALHIDRAITF